MRHPTWSFERLVPLRGTIEYKYDVAVACNGDGLDEFYSDDGVEKVGAAHYLKYFRECYNLDDRPC